MLMAVSVGWETVKLPEKGPKRWAASLGRVERMNVERGEGGVSLEGKWKPEGGKPGGV